MVLYFFDASALIRYYILEPGSTWVRELIKATDEQSKQPSHTVFMVDIITAEIATAFAILYRMKRIRHR